MFDENKLKEVADRYNLIARKVDNKEEAGFFVNGKKVSDNELFELLFIDQPDTKDE